jgi:flavodoxin
MKAVVVVHSKTGSTLEFGNIIAEKLKEKGHSVDVVRLETDAPVDSNPRSQQKLKFTNLPDASRYDAVFAGGPVWGFSASPVIMQAVKEMKLSGKKVLPFVTHGLPFAALGAKQSIEAMKKTAKDAGAEVLGGKTAHMKDQKAKEKAAAEIAALF